MEINGERAFRKKPKLSELTLREKIGQTALMQESVLANREDIAEYLKENPIGNVWQIGNNWMGATNLTETSSGIAEDSHYHREWAESLRSMLKIPPLIGLDAPGSGSAIDLPELSSLPLVGAADDMELAYRHGQAVAKNVSAIGGNYVWGPEADISSRFAAVFLMRTASSDPDQLIAMNQQIIKGIQSEGIAATAKHFPGNDQIEYRDPHFSPAYNHSSKEEWKAKQGRVFQALIDSGVYSIMVGHQGFPAIDDRKIGKTYMPATLSHNIITKLLKEEMGFNGVVITDAIDMAGLYALYPNREDLYVALLEAGNDVLDNVRDYDYIDIVEKAVKDGRLSESRIDDACRRVLDMKEKLGLFDNPVQTVMNEEIYHSISALNQEIANKAMTLECDTDGLLPFDASKIKNVAIICSTHAQRGFDALQSMKEDLEGRGMKVRLQRRIRSEEEMREIDKENDLIIYTSFIAPHAPMGAASLYGEEVETFFYALTKGAEKSACVSFGSPYVYYDFYQSAKVFVHAYSLCPEAQKAFIATIFGEIPFEGKFPFEPAGPRTE